jgi:ribosomal-protein-alanine N-acetyltransferase
MRIADIEGVMAIEREIFTSPWTAKFFLHELQKGNRAIYLVAATVGELLGYMGAQVLGEEIHITNMAVAERYRRRGLGSALLIACVRRGTESGARWLTLEVREGNHQARSFYRLFGFDEIGLRRSYYPDSGEDAVIMVTGDIRTPAFQELIDDMEASRVSKEEDG